jgi:ATP-dependent Lhr-like helicase
MLAQLEKAAGGATGNDADTVRQSLSFGREGAANKTPDTTQRERRPRRPRLPR